MLPDVSWEQKSPPVENHCSNSVILSVCWAPCFLWLLKWGEGSQPHWMQTNLNLHPEMAGYKLSISFVLARENPGLGSGWSKGLKACDFTGKCPPGDTDTAGQKQVVSHLLIGLLGKEHRSLQSIGCFSLPEVLWFRWKKFTWMWTHNTLQSVLTPTKHILRLTVELVTTFWPNEKLRYFSCLIKLIFLFPVSW